MTPQKQIEPDIQVDKNTTETAPGNGSQEVSGNDTTMYTTKPMSPELKQGQTAKAERRDQDNSKATTDHKILIENVNFYYGKSHALHDISLKIPSNKVTAFIGPSGCGKSTLLRALNRMHDLIPKARLEG